MVDDSNAVLTDGAHPQLRLEGHAELAYEDHVQWGVERFGDLEGDRYATARQTDHHDIGSSQVVQLLGQATSSVDAIDEEHVHLLASRASIAVEARSSRGLFREPGSP